MALKPDTSIMASLAVAAMVYGVHAAFTPNMADMQAVPAGNTDMDKAERKATWASAAVVATVSLLAKDPTIFVIGSAVTIGMSLFSRHAIWSEPAALMSPYAPGAAQATSANDLATGPIPVGATSPYEMFAGQNNEFIQ